MSKFIEITDDGTQTTSIRYNMQSNIVLTIIIIIIIIIMTTHLAWEGMLNGMMVFCLKDKGMFAIFRRGMVVE